MAPSHRATCIRPSWQSHVQHDVQSQHPAATNFDPSCCYDKFGFVRWTGLSAFVTDNNLFVTDSGLNSWPIVYTVTSGPKGGQILAYGVLPVSFFTQQEVDLGLISHKNNGDSSGTDNLTFTVSDGVGGTIGRTSFGINVIPENNLRVNVGRPVRNVASNGFTDGSNNPVRASIVSSNILSSVDPGADPANITYTVQSISDQSGFFLIGSLAKKDLSSFEGGSFGSAYIYFKNQGVFYPIFSFSQAEISPRGKFVGRAGLRGAVAPNTAIRRTLPERL